MACWRDRLASRPPSGTGKWRPATAGERLRDEGVLFWPLSEQETAVKTIVNDVAGPGRGGLQQGESSRMNLSMSMPLGVKSTGAGIKCLVIIMAF